MKRKDGAIFVEGHQIRGGEWCDVRAMRSAKCGSGEVTVWRERRDWWSSSAIWILGIACGRK